LARTPPTVTVETEGHTTTIAVIPDGWLLFESGDGEKFPILLEIDRGTEYQERFKQHLKARIEFIRSGVYARVFQTPAVVVAYVTTGQIPEYRESRRTTMQRWTQELLAHLDLADWASRFRFASVEYDKLYTTPLFDAPMWYRPDDPTPVPLLTP